MNNNLKYLAIFVFIAVLIVAIVIGYKKGKEKASKLSSNVSDRVLPYESSLKIKKKKNTLLQPKPILFQLQEKAFEPYSYTLRVNNIEERFTIIDEKGDKIEDSQSDQLVFNLFSLNILDYDIKREENLQKAVKFNFEKDSQEEFFKGMVEASDFEEQTKNSNSKTENNLKGPEHQIHTNLK